MLSLENRVVNGLWIGERLSILEILTLKSFVYHGHEFHLWSYGKIETPLPKGVILKDADLIIPKKDIITRKYNDPATGVGKGSVGAPFSDLFRYKLLYEQGGWWVDMDVTCLKPLEIEKPYFFRDHLYLDVIGNIIKCPKGSELMLRTYNEVKKTCNENTLDWLLPNKILNKHIHELGLIKYRLKDISNMDDWNETKIFIRSNRHLPANWYVIHWSNEEWRKNHLDKNNIRRRNSTFGKLIQKFEVPVGEVNYLKLFLNEILLARPFHVFRRITDFVNQIFWYFNGHFKFYKRSILKAYFFKRKIILNPLICYAPFKSMYFSYDGSVNSCCVNRTHVLGNYPDQEIIQIWKGEQINKIRLHLKNNDLSLGCQDCKYWLENRNSKDLRALFYDSYQVNKEWPVIMEFELSNTCNLECMMCYGEFSSSIRKNREKLPPINMAYDDNFVEQLTEFIPHLKKAQFAGGEPFLIKVYHQIWEKIIELSPDCIIGVQTNGTILNDTVRSLLNRGNFQVGVSLDSLQKDTYESIRKNASYDDVMQNIRYFTEYSKNKNIPMHITVCPMRINWKELPALVEFCNVLNVFIRFNTVWKPAQYALWNLPPDELKEICNYLFDKKPVGNNPVSKKNSRYYSGYINQINSWYEDGLSRQTEIEKIESISVDELEANIFLKLKNYLEKTDDQELQYMGEGSDFYLNKLKSVFDMFAVDLNFKMALIELLNNYPEELIIQELKENSVESLFQKAKSLSDERIKMNNEKYLYS